MKNSPLLHLSVLTLILAAPACEFLHGTFHHDGTSYSESNGVLYADDVPLRFERWIKLEPPLAAGSQISMATYTGEVTLSAATAGEASALELHLFSEIENDGGVLVKDGKLATHSDTDHKLAINGVRGSVPADVSLDIETGTGDLSLKGLSGKSSIKISTGTGRSTLEGCQVASVALETGTGDMTMRDVHSTTLGIDTGTGETRLTGCAADELNFSSGTGDLRLDDCHFKESKLDSGTGDIRLRKGSTLGSETHDLGTGSVKTSDGE